VRAVILGSDDVAADAQAWAAAELAAIAADIRAWPMGMATQVSSAQLSRSQLQRLLLARALAAGPAVLLLDDATSGLDDLARQHVHAAIRRLRMTRIVVTGQADLLRAADRVVVLAAGRVTGHRIRPERPEGASTLRPGLASRCPARQAAQARPGTP
jgi:ABC-type bacteriocin/lantibiotic exporter with double-glycine peptidase domain